jgi:uncharacterized protein YciI
VSFVHFCGHYFFFVGAQFIAPATMDGRNKLRPYPILGANMHYLMFYEFVPDYLERRGQFRVEHLQLAWAANERGELVLGGALADPADGAVLLFNCVSPDVPERFAAADPYVKYDLVTRWYVRPWTTVVGRDAATPARLPGPCVNPDSC